MLDKRLCEVCNQEKEIVFQKNARIGSMVGRTADPPMWICYECHNRSNGKYFRGKRNYGNHHKRKWQEVDEIIRQMPQ